jgi:hypothetical protein
MSTLRPEKSNRSFTAIALAPVMPANLAAASRHSGTAAPLCGSMTTTGAQSAPA